MNLEFNPRGQPIGSAVIGWTRWSRAGTETPFGMRRLTLNGQTFKELLKHGFPRKTSTPLAGNESGFLY